MSGTKQAEHTLSATDTVDNTDFEAIQRAMLDGNSEELDRLMAAEVAENVEEKVEETVSENAEELTSKPEETSNEDETTSSEEESKTEAAPSAASTADATDELERLRKEVHQYKSDAGRMPFIQRRMAELERELRAYKARDAAPTQGDGKTTTVDTSKVDIDPELKKQIDELKEIDPVLARTMELMAKTAVASANQRVEHAVTTMTQADQEADDYRHYTEQKQILLNAIPQADAIFATPEWQKWKEGLSPGKRAMAESGYADDVILAVNAFAADMQRLHGNASAPAATTTVETPAEKSEVTEARERKVATTVETKSPSAKKAAVFDEEAAFREIYNQVAKANHIL